VEELERRAIRVWMRTVMSSQGWSANEWAVKANTSPTNITRFLNSDATYIPTSRTLGKLAFVAGSNPQLINKGQEGGLVKHPVKNSNGETVDMIVVDDSSVELYKLGYWTGMGMMGIMSHSTVVIKPYNKKKDIKDGDIVLYRSEACGFLCGIIENNQICYYPRNPTQLPDTFTEGQSWRPIKISNLKNNIIGKVIQCMNNF